jgi:hypothetical protein
MVCYRTIGMNERKPGFDLRKLALIEGRPSRVAVTSDGLRVLVFQDDLGQVTGLDSAGLRILGHDLLGVSDGRRRLLRGRWGDLFYCAGSAGRLAVFHASVLQFRSSVTVDGDPVDLEFLPDGSRAFLSLETGDGGTIERRGGVPLAAAGRMDLHGRPLPETLALCPRLGLGAVLVKPPEGAEEVVVWTVEPFAIVLRLPVAGGAGALAFSDREDLLFVARPEHSEVLGIDVPRGGVSRRIMMLGRAFHLAGQPLETGIWALSGRIPHLVRVDLPLGAGPAPVRLEGVEPSAARLRFSPEGRLAALPLRDSGELLLLDMYADEPTYGTVLDRLELGRPLMDAAWSPLGDELFTVGADGSVSAFSVDRGDRSVRDTGHYLIENLRLAAKRQGPKNPLFPP